MVNSFMKRCSASLITKEVQIKMTLRYNLHSLRWLLSKSQEMTNIGEGMEKRNVHSVDGNVDWCCHYGKQHGGS